MKYKLMLLGVLVVLLLGGCAMTPRQKLFSGYQSYKAVAVLLIKARQDGTIESDSLWVRILEIDSIVYRRLIGYAESIDRGRPDEAEWQAFNAALDKLLEIYQRLPEPTDQPLPNSPMFMEVVKWPRKRSFWRSYESGSRSRPSASLSRLYNSRLA